MERVPFDDEKARLLNSGIGGASGVALSGRWVLTEAYLKGLGVGMTEGIGGLGFRRREARSFWVTDHPRPAVAARWRLALLRPSPHHLVAVATEDGGPLRCHEPARTRLARQTPPSDPLWVRTSHVPAQPLNIAVIGAGPAGLSAAYHLRDRARITVFEREPRPGGHANTVEVEENGRVLGLDTAFIVFNQPAYPRLTAFFDELGVESVPHPGGFTFFDLDSGLEFGSDELELDEVSIEERYAARHPEFPRIWREARRFHEEGRRDFVRGRAHMSMGEYLDQHGYSQEFRHSYLIMLCSAVWSVPAELVWEIPAATVIAFFVGHGEGGLGGRRVGGSAGGRWAVARSPMSARRSRRSVPTCACPSPRPPSGRRRTGSP